MKFTNKHGLPETLIRAAQVNEAGYSKGAVDRSVTQLIQSPRIDALRKGHFSEMQKDISEEFWALFGSAVHSILEMGAGPNDVVEERLYAEVDGWLVSGMADLREQFEDGVVISDYKVTTAFALMQSGGPVKPEWECQLNLLAYLFKQNFPEQTVKGLQVVAIIRDWQRTQAAIDTFYPQSPVVPLKASLWSRQRQTAYIRDRVRAHREAEMLLALDETLPECSDEDRWMRESKWAVIKIGGKKAAKVHDSEADADADLAERKPGYEIQYRPGKSTRCEGNYCGVAEWCDQFAKIKQSESATEPEQNT